ncbi:PREDICTED: carbohydrate sulfotransferase 1-like [Priapulus caudatus]|uniref:Carbohydrate sulfotransferase 1-like n=1 Tax=Priapulus caudatus TaxID=37621 RepID=A0ABM1F932_PRICU|nr:PREDICTED: carbohydrate sulfotransferase 1-like [Priapulus caudatus]
MGEMTSAAKSRRKVVLVASTGVLLLLLMLLFTMRLSLFDIVRQTGSPLPGDVANDVVATHAQQQRRAVVLLAYHRGGSSFTGDLLNEHARVFYLYEPLRQPWFAATAAAAAADRHQLDALAVRLTPAFLLCRFSEMSIDWIAELLKKNYTKLAHTKALLTRPGCGEAERTEEGRGRSAADGWSEGSGWSKGGRSDRRSGSEEGRGESGESAGVSAAPPPCRLGALTIADVEDECRRRDVVAVKLIRPSLADGVAPLLDDPRFSLKVVHVVRDPRGVVASLHKLPEYHTDHVTAAMMSAAADRLCKRMRGNVAAGMRLPAASYLLLRYEDAATQTARTMKTLYDFVGLDAGRQSLDDFVAAHTGTDANADDGINWRTVRRNFTAVALSWQNVLDEKSVRQVEQVCEDVLATLGYHLLNSSSNSYIYRKFSTNCIGTRIGMEMLGMWARQGYIILPYKTNQ